MGYFFINAYLFFNTIFVVLILLCQFIQRGENHGDNYVPSSNICLQYLCVIEDINACYQIGA
jgi:hypothetical protein